MAPSSYTAVTALNSATSADTVATPLPVNSKEKVSEAVVQDAVKVSLSNDAPQVPADKAQEEQARGRAEELAQNFKQSLNQTALRFDVQLFDKGQKAGGFLSAFSFKVVDKETGKVVRQFPPEAIIEADLKSSAPTTGLLVSKTV